jgi:hypothetical protein
LTGRGEVESERGKRGLSFEDITGEVSEGVVDVSDANIDSVAGMAGTDKEGVSAERGMSGTLTEGNGVSGGMGIWMRLSLF